MLLALRKVTLPGLIVVGVILQFLKFLCLLITHLRLSHFRIFLEKFNPLWIVTPCLSWQIIHFRNKDDKNEIANRAKHKVLSCNIYVEPQNLKEYKINTHTHKRTLWNIMQDRANNKEDHLLELNSGQKVNLPFPIIK